MVFGRGLEPKLLEDAGDVLLDGAFRDRELIGDRQVRPPFGHQLEHFALARGEVAEWVTTGSPADELRDDLRVERRASIGDMLDRFDEALDVGHTVLEQVAHPAAGGVGDELERVALLDVLREHEDGCIGVAPSDLERRPQPIVRIRRRHADIHHRHLGLVRRDLAHELRGVARLADDLEAPLFQQPHEALPQQHRVVRNHYPHGDPASRPPRLPSGPKRWKGPPSSSRLPTVTVRLPSAGGLGG